MEKKALQHGHIEIWLDSYDDMFSDFDPRPYSKRTLSDDFIMQVQKVAESEKEKIHAIELFLPESVRNTDKEKMILKKLRLFFLNTHEHLRKEKKREMLKGILFMLSGAILMVTASYFSFKKADRFFWHLLMVLFEPAGWLLIWKGSDSINYLSPKKRREMQFYSQMSGARIYFTGMCM